MVNKLTAAKEAFGCCAVRDLQKRAYEIDNLVVILLLGRKRLQKQLQVFLQFLSGVLEHVVVVLYESMEGCNGIPDRRGRRTGVDFWSAVCNFALGSVSAVGFGAQVTAFLGGLC